MCTHFFLALHIISSCLYLYVYRNLQHRSQHSFSWPECSFAYPLNHQKANRVRSDEQKHHNIYMNIHSSCHFLNTFFFVRSGSVFSKEFTSFSAMPFLCKLFLFFFYLEFFFFLSCVAFWLRLEYYFIDFRCGHFFLFSFSLAHRVPMQKKKKERKFYHRN